MPIQSRRLRLPHVATISPLPATSARSPSHSAPAGEADGRRDTPRAIGVSPWFTLVMA